MGNPGVKFPPPLIYVLFFAAGVSFEKLAPLHIPQVPYVHEAGWFLAAVSIIVAGLGFFEFYRVRTNVLPDRPASALITGGIYRFTRNPLYLAMLLLYIGTGVFFLFWWSLIIVPLLVWMVNVYVIRREEQYLSERFGDAYIEYCRRVRRWL